MQQPRGTAGTWVQYAYCISLLIITFKRYSKPQFIPDGKSRFLPGIPYTMLSFFFGWWGFPFGLIYTPWAIFENLGGGRVIGRDEGDYGAEAGWGQPYG